MEGRYVFPAPPGEKKSHKKAEHSGGAKWGMTRDPEEIPRDFARWPNANVGLPAGEANGFFVVDVDTKEGHDVDGIASLRQLVAEHGKLPATLTAESPSGSRCTFTSNISDQARRSETLHRRSLPASTCAARAA
jgi:Bifunctional DNA primase/polymerase, N-terminal